MQQAYYYGRPPARRSFGGYYPNYRLDPRLNQSAIVVAADKDYEQAQHITRRAASQRSSVPQTMMRNGYDNNSAKLGVEQSGRMREDSDYKSVMHMQRMKAQTKPRDKMISGKSLQFLSRGDEDD